MRDEMKDEMRDEMRDVLEAAEQIVELFEKWQDLCDLEELFTLISNRPGREWPEVIFGAEQAKEIHSLVELTIEEQPPFTDAQIDRIYWSTFYLTRTVVNEMIGAKTPHGRPPEVKPKTLSLNCVKCGVPEIEVHSVSQVREAYRDSTSRLCRECVKAEKTRQEAEMKALRARREAERAKRDAERVEKNAKRPSVEPRRLSGLEKEAINWLLRQDIDKLSDFHASLRQTAVHWHEAEVKKHDAPLSPRQFDYVIEAYQESIRHNGHDNRKAQFVLDEFPFITADGHKLLLTFEQRLIATALSVAEELSEAELMLATQLDRGAFINAVKGSQHFRTDGRKWSLA